MRGAFLEDLTWPEARDRMAAGAVVVIPVILALFPDAAP